MYSKPSWWNSLEIQWISIHLPMREMWVRSRVREESTCRGATKLVCHNYWGPRAHRPGSTARGATTVRSLRTTVKSSPCSPQLGKARVQQQRPSAAKKKKKKSVTFSNTPTPLPPFTSQNSGTIVSQVEKDITLQKLHCARMWQKSETWSKTTGSLQFSQTEKIIHELSMNNYTINRTHKAQSS